MYVYYVLESSRDNQSTTYRKAYERIRSVRSGLPKNQIEIIDVMRRGEQAYSVFGLSGEAKHLREGTLEWVVLRWSSLTVRNVLVVSLLFVSITKQGYSSFRYTPLCLKGGFHFFAKMSLLCTGRFG